MCQTHEGGFVHAFRACTNAISNNFGALTGAPKKKRQQVPFCPKTERATYVNVRKSAQVNTLASQATKDVASCEKLGGAANKR